MEPLVDNKEDLYYKEVLRRSDDIDQLTVDYITALMDCDDDAEADFGIEELESIINDFEAVLYEHGIVIYRPVIAENNRGDEVLLYSSYIEMPD